MISTETGGDVLKRSKHVFSPTFCHCQSIHKSEVKSVFSGGTVINRNLHYHAAWASISCVTLWLHQGWGSFRLACTCPRSCFHARALHSSLPEHSWHDPALPCSFLFCPHQEEKKQQGGKVHPKCQVVCVSVKNACRVSSLRWMQPWYWSRLCLLTTESVAH